MSDIKTGRYWDKPWSLVDGCTPCSPGCENCWSRSLGKRFGRWPEKATIRPDRLHIPLETNKPTVWAVWNDLFHEDVPNCFIEAAFLTMAGFSRESDTCITNHLPIHIFLVLTKRHKRMARFMAEYIFPSGDTLSATMLSNVWYGLTVCNQQEVEEKIPLFLSVQDHKWLSIEPSLSHITLWEQIGGIRLVEYFDWIVIGAETGQHRRQCNIENIRNIVDECSVVGVPVWVKTVDLGKRVSHSMEEWPEELRVRQYPTEWQIIDGKPTCTAFQKEE